MAANEGEEPTVSLVDVVEEDEQLEEEASAVLGGSDPDKCSYPEGYVNRQALYACNTCTPKGGEPAGVCLACSYKCHEGHELFELYTKRNFRCDCGNSKFPEFECKLHVEKEQLNTDNKYSHNFFGLYCTCDRPYPDPEDQAADEMIQCVVCEDWFHGRHLGCVVPESVELQEMVCEACMNKAPFLWTYAAHIAVPPVTKVTPIKTEEAVKVEDDGNNDVQKEEAEVDSRTNGTEEMRNTPTGFKRTYQEMDDQTQKKLSVKADRCELDLLQTGGVCRQGAVFFPYVWRNKLCSCSSCKETYSKAGLSFLLDESDTVLAYETKGKITERARASEGRDPLMSALNNLNRVQQLEIIYEYNDMKTALKDYLQRFAEAGRVVTPEDVQRFFEEQQTRKRRRTNAGEYYCS